MRHNDLKKSKLAQAATELAIFGGIIIFLIGGIVRSAVSSSFQQNNQLKALRLALLSSYENSMKKQGVGRNSASILYIEDRLSPDIAKYGTLERAPFIASGSGTISNLLMFPVDAVDLSPGAQQDKNLPMMDIYINGKHFTFSTAAVSGKSLPAVFYQISITPGDYGILTPEEAFNLDRSGDFSHDPPPYGTNGTVDASYMAWHWKGVDAATAAAAIDTKNGNYPSYDVDNDMQEEIVYSVDAGGVSVLDNQDGDVDLTFDSFTAFRNTGAPQVRPGLQSEMQIFTQADRPDQGYLVIKEGRLYNPETGVFVRSTSKKDQVSVVRRMFQLSNDTGRFCSGGTPSPQNPMVEKCGSCSDDVSKTCFEPSTKILFISSRILDKRGRFWKTDISKGLP